MSNELARQEQLKPILAASQKQFQSLLASKEKSDKFMAAALVVASDKAFFNCEPQSIVTALTQVAMLDLSCDKNLGHAYLIPYGQTVQLQIGYKGHKCLLKREGYDVRAFPVYTCDSYSERLSENCWDNVIHFEKNLEQRQDSNDNWVLENLKGILVSLKHKSGEIHSELVSIGDIEKRRKSSPNQKNSANPTGIWQKWYLEMATAKAVKKVCKSVLTEETNALSASYIDDDVPQKEIEINPQLKTEDEPTAYEVPMQQGQQVRQEPEVQESQVVINAKQALNDCDNYARFAQLDEWIKGFPPQDIEALKDFVEKKRGEFAVVATIEADI